MKEQRPIFSTICTDSPPTGAMEILPTAQRSDAAPVTGIAVDSSGRIFASGGGAEPLQELDASGFIIRAWGREFIGAKHGLRCFWGVLYATDVGNHQVCKMTLDGKPLLFLGEKGVPGCDRTHFDQPTDVAVAPDGDIYVTDGYGNRRVVCFDARGCYKFEWGRPGEAPGEFNNPHNIAIGSDNRVYVADRDNRRLQVFDRSGELLEIRQDSGQIFGLDSDGVRLFVTVARPGWHGVLVTTLDGTLLGSCGGQGTAPGKFDVPHSVAWDPVRNCLWVGEVANRRIQKINFLGKTK